MISTKERSTLKGIAVNLQAKMQIGKDGLTENSINQILEMLEKNEIVKISVLNNCDYTAKELINLVCEKISCEPVLAIGNKIVVYKKSTRKDVKHIL